MTNQDTGFMAHDTVELLTDWRIKFYGVRILEDVHTALKKGERFDQAVLDMELGSMSFFPEDRNEAMRVIEVRQTVSVEPVTRDTEA